ncbi:hypothetical protein K466DRAFT_136299 [Polyporus arcularius HHB13444]|uniref:Uncharacterized protein n=1 Tax=Polyporus arcularius HHB13444 TaxID=1314778 RepID=A0A5C3PD33_9APHY|nr:hypothetical protein K466DRAFT_136299 [Polyporus arcularius HHB13444]
MTRRQWFPHSLGGVESACHQLRGPTGPANLGLGFLCTLAQLEHSLALTWSSPSINATEEARNNDARHQETPAGENTPAFWQETPQRTNLQSLSARSRTFAQELRWTVPLDRHRSAMLHRGQLLSFHRSCPSGESGVPWEPPATESSQWLPGPPLNLSLCQR